MTQKDRKSIQLKFESVRTRRFEVFEPAEQISPDDLAFLYTIEVESDQTRSNAIVTVQVKVVTDDPEEEILAEVATTTIFAIRGLDNGNSESSAPLPQDLMMTLTSLAVSTTRGILVERTANTELGTVILPPFDPVAFFDANDEPAAAAPSMS